MRNLHATSAPSRFPRSLAPLLAAATLLGTAAAARAQDAAGTVTHLSGLLTATRSDGSARLLAPRSVVREGETLVTAAGTYMEVRFVDDATLILGPDSQLQVIRYAWNPDKPASDIVQLDLQRGSMSSVTGRLGKRNHDAIRVKVPGGEIGVHGTTYVAQVVAPGLSIAPGSVQSAGPAPAAAGALAPGLYVHVIDGMINVSNGGGSQIFAAGQFGFTASVSQPPVVVPRNPGLVFTPPPAFSAPITPGSTGTTKSNTVDCEVR